MRYLFIAAMILLSSALLFADSTSVNDIGVRHYDLTLRLNITYVPICPIDRSNTNTTYEVYDNVFYRLSAEYSFMDFIAAGISGEYMSKSIEPVVIFHRDITVYNILADFKLVHNLTDTGNSKMIFGFGTGLASLSEKNGDSNTGVIFYAATGFDFALWKNFGLDLIYRHQFTQLKVEYSEYKFNGSTLQFGVNYGINL